MPRVTACSPPSQTPFKRPERLSSVGQFAANPDSNEPDERMYVSAGVIQRVNHPLPCSRITTDQATHLQFIHPPPA